jgi:PadR family transcriptional regulator
MPRKQRRLSDEAAEVLRLFLNAPERARFGLEIIRLARIRSGSLYPILHRFEARGLIVATWEDTDLAERARRRPRREYRLEPSQTGKAEKLYLEWEAATSRRQPSSAKAHPVHGPRIAT